MSFLYFVTASYGLTSVLVYGKIFNKLRPTHHFFHCPTCVGFWVGIFLMLLNPYTELFTYTISITNAFLLGGISSGASYVLSMIFADEGIRHEHKIRRDVDTEVDAKTRNQLLQG
jgi:hypothetical protein|tara:strand:- start:1512 stop:1856 length:345 start_codon:yes stop_codon:yes gene_type:complete